MNSKIAIVGAGSIGNHLAYSCRKLGWDVEVFDIDVQALDRFKNDIYPNRYGQFDENIKFHLYSGFSDFKTGYFDVVLIGTPPEHHAAIAAAATAIKPKIVLIEKPITGPNADHLAILKTLIVQNPEIIFLCGYTHKVNLATVAASGLIQRMKNDGKVSLNVRWQESWDGILNAHPWLKDQNDSYLGFFERGGGSLFEHSHGLDMWLHFARLLEFGAVTEVKAKGVFQNDKEGNRQYDESMTLDLVTTSGKYGRVIQDVVTFPAIKELHVESENYHLVLGFNDKVMGDFVVFTEKKSGTEIMRMAISKTRPFDFDLEINEISKILNSIVSGVPFNSVLNAEYGIYVAEIASESLSNALA